MKSVASPNKASACHVLSSCTEKKSGFNLIYPNLPYPNLLYPSVVAVFALMQVACAMVPVLKEDGFSVPGQFKEVKNSNPTAKDVQSINALNPSAQAPNTLTDNNVPITKFFSSKRPFLTSNAWWTELKDPVLNRLQDQLQTGNISILQLSAQVRVAQASLKQAEASLFPSMNVNLSASRAANQLSVPKGTSYSLSSPMSWELDVWGRIDALTQVASANAMASAWDLSQAKVSAQALLVQTYVATQAAMGQEALLGNMVQAYEKTLSLTQARYKAGVVSSADVALASTQLKTTQAQLQEVVLQRKQLEHAVATLLGTVPAQLELKPLDLQSVTVSESASKSASKSESQPVDFQAIERLPRTPDLPDVLVLDVLEFRSDIQAAKRRVEAANAQLGVARAAFFPPLVLSASAGYRNTDFASLISASNQAWSIGPSLVLPFLDGGLRQAAKEGAQAQLDNAVLAYRQVVLNAFQEIEDNLVASEQLSLSAKSWSEALQSARRNLEVNLAQYKAGVVPFLNVVNAQSTFLSTQRSLLDVQSRRLFAWNVLKKNTFVSQEN